MLKITEGDLFSFLTEPCVIAHGCNTLGTMGEGFAKQMRERFPFNFLEYRQLCNNGRAKVGEWLWVYDSGVCIFNLFTQESYGYDKNVVYVNYPAVEKGLRVVERYGRTYGLPIHLPFIGGGFANGDHKILMEIFERVFNPQPPNAESVPTRLRKKGVKPKELPPPADAMLYILPESKHGHHRHK